MIAFEVPGNPRGKGRPRMTRSGHVYTPSETAAYENLIALACRDARGNKGPFTGPVAMHIHVGKQVPASKSKRTRQAMLAGEIRPATKPDLDNVIKAVLDGCNGVAYLDDRQIVELTATAHYAESPGVRVVIEEV